MPKPTFGMFCCVLLLAGCAAASKPVVDSALPRAGSEGTKLFPPPGGVPDRLPPLTPAHANPTDVLPPKGESDQQVDPRKLRQQQ